MKTFRSVTLTRAPIHQDAVDAHSLERPRSAFLAPDLIGLQLLTLVAAVVVLIDGPTTARVILGVPLIFFYPGYALVSLLFPTRTTVDGIERIALAFGLSIAIIPLVSLSLDRSRWSISVEPIVVALVLVTTTLTLLAAVRRSRIPAPDRFTVVSRLPAIPPIGTWERPTRIAVGLLGIAFVLLIVGGAPAMIERFAGEPTTEFALFNSAGQAEFYEREVPVGEPVSATLSITNRERQSVSYEIRVAGEGVAVESPAPVKLARGETWTGQVRYTVNREGEEIPVLFELRRDDQSPTDPPYRTLRLMVDGVPIA